jgi:cephalosporin-C deacetylase-like acetyl esterase
MVSKLSVRIPADEGVELGAWLFVPEGTGTHPAITMAHGFAGIKEHGLDPFAQAFAASRAMTSTPGRKSRTGVARSPTSKRVPKSIGPGSVCGARATPADTRSSSAPRIVACVASSHRSRQ